MFIKQNICNMLLVVILLIITDLSHQTPLKCSDNDCDTKEAVGKCSPKISNAIDIFCELNGITQDCTKDVPEGTISYMNCKLNYIDIHTPEPSVSICRNGKWNLPPKQCVPDCDQIVPDGHTTIVKGNSAKRGEFPWHVGIYRQKPDGPQKYICGGSIISVKIVISAAHCFTDANTGKLYPSSEFVVAAGKYYSNWNAREDAYYVQKKQIIKIEIPDDKYFGGLTNYAADIAALVVNNAFILTSFVKPVCVDWNLEHFNPQITDGTQGKVAGWGATASENPAASLELKQLIVPYIGRSQCTTIVPENFIPFVTLDKYCAGYTNGSSVCGGDSGGGMVIPYEDTGKKRYYLQGIVSAGPGKDGSCDDFQIGVYTRVSDYITFIRRIEESNRLITVYRRHQGCAAPIIENGKFIISDIDYKPGSLIKESFVIIIECNSGYERSVNNFPVCIAGVWNKEVPKCVQSSRLVLPAGNECPVPVIEHGKYHILGYLPYKYGDSIPNYSIVNFTCNVNYELNTTYSLVNCLNGTFSFNLPKCVSTKCPARISNSIEVDCELNGIKLDCSKEVPSGTVATMKCKSEDETYPEPATATCFGSSWDVPLKECTSECKGSHMISEESVQDCGEILFNATEELDFVKRGDVPWHVGIYRIEPQQSAVLKCGGSIISEKIVLTIAHCFTFNRLAKLHPISEFYVAAGKQYNSWNSPKDVGFVQKRKICKLNIPSTYEGAASKFEGNIAVVIVDKPFEFSNWVKPICVDWNSEYVDQQIKGGALGLISGWGYGDDISPILTYVTAPILDLVQCYKTIPNTEKKYLTDDKYCAGSINGSNLCSVDHGGGMVFAYEKLGKKKYVIQGIKSDFLAPNNDCNRNLLNTFTRVVDYISFIRNVTSFNQIH